MKRFSFRILLLANVFLALGYTTVKAQLGVGQWRTHISYAFIQHVANGGDYLYAAANKGLFRYDIGNGSIEPYTTVTRLSDVGISAVCYDVDKSVLLVGYSNGNLDLVYEDKTVNIADFKRKAILGDKRIYDIVVDNQEMYLATGIGVLVFDLTKKEFKDTYVLGNDGAYLRVTKLALQGDYIFAGTQQGFFVGEKGSAELLFDEGWEAFSIGGLENREVTAFSALGDEWLVAVQEGAEQSSLYLISETADQQLIVGEGLIYDVMAVGQQYAVAFTNKVKVFTNAHSQVANYEQYGGFNARPRSLCGDEQNGFWAADYGAGLVKLSTEPRNIIPNGPYGEDIFRVRNAGKFTYAVPGAVDESWDNVYISSRLYSYRNSVWETLFDYSTYDAIDLAVAPNNSDKVAMALWGKGVLIVNNEKIENYNPENSSLIENAYGQCRVGGVAYDDEGNLWMTQSVSSVSLHVCTAGGEWQAFDFNGKLSNTYISDILIDDYGYKWMILPRGGGLWVYDDNQTPLNDKDDRYQQVPVVDENGSFITSEVYCFAKDLEGAIWIGTDNGVAIFSDPGQVFGDDLFYARRPTITIDGQTQRLLNGNMVTSIAVDGANKKWIGTRSAGVFYVTKDGDDLVQQYATNNSPLFANHILSVSVNDITGEVFFATREGLLSYGGAATLGGDDFGDVYAYPNPVRENYEGDIIVKGLLRDALVKITDVSGNIVYETRAEGGQAVWNGKNFDGNRVSTGVYLVFCTNPDGTKTHVTKLLFIH